MRPVEDIVNDLEAVRERWWTFNGTERAASQTFLNQLVGCFTGLPDVFQAGATFEQFGSRAKGSGYMDLHWPELCIIEMKAPSETRRLEKHRDQVIDYWRHSADVARQIPAPRFLVLCSFLKFEVWEPGRFPNAPLDVFTIEELPQHYGSLMFLAGAEPTIGGPGQELSVKAAKAVAEVYYKLRDRDAADADTLRRFILQLTWCLFAEDLNMLPGQPVTRLLRSLARDQTRSSAVELGGFFYALSIPNQRERDDTGFEQLPFVNGGLLERAARVRLNVDELELLIEAADHDWRDVNPTIFGGLMEECLGHDRRWELGAHYTFEQDIMSIVEPTVVRPWLQRINAAATPAEADAVVGEISRFRVLDPACGCGNFLAVSYRELRHLLAQAIDRQHRVYAAAGMQPPNTAPYYPLSNIYGIEIEPFAVELSRVTLWMTHKLVADLYGQAEPVLPLVDLEHIVCADALATPWPEVDAIVSNPPYHGTKSLRGVLGDDYVAWLRQEFNIGIKDLCIYWFRRAVDALPANGRAGLVATNSIREGKNREAGLDHVVATGGVITDAISSKLWPGEAKVTVSLVNWIQSPDVAPTSFTLDGVPVDGITTSLKAGVQREDPKPLVQNAGRQFYGVVPGGEMFVIMANTGERWVRESSAYRDVVGPYLIGDDIAKNPTQSPRRWIVNFGEMPLEQAMAYPAALEHVRRHVKPMRDEHPKKREREQWWKPSRSVQETFAAISGLSRYIACPATGKRFPMIWCQPDWIPSNATSVFAFDDDWTFGVLSSRLHQRWAVEVSTKLRSDARYTKASFSTFPFPPRVPDEVVRIESAAQKIVSLRSTYTEASGLGLTALYNAVDEGAYADLAHAHRELDQAVCRSYLWPETILDEPGLAHSALLDLNFAIANGSVAYRPF